MAEEKKSNVFKMIIKVIVGIILIALGVVSICYWWSDLLILVRGVIGIVLVLAGLIFFAITKD